MVRMGNGGAEINLLACGYTRSQLRGYRTGVQARNLKPLFWLFAAQERCIAVRISLVLDAQRICNQIFLLLLANVGKYIFLL